MSGNTAPGACVQRRMATHGSPRRRCRSRRSWSQESSRAPAVALASASATSMSSRYQTTRASLKRWAILEAPWVPKPRRFSETKTSRSAPEGRSVEVARSLGSARKTVPTLCSSEGAMTSWLK